MKKQILLIVVLLLSLSTFAGRQHLQFNNSEFKILQVTDLHLMAKDQYALKNDSSFSLIRHMIEKEHPDLVMITGDIVVSYNAQEVWEELSQIFEEEKTCFAITFGNHDNESDMAKEAVVKLLSRNSYYVEGNLAPSDISGIGNAYVPILSKDGSVSQWVLYLFDSHNLSQDQGLGYYDWIKPDQIAWYRGVSDSLRSVNKKKLPAVAFFHIPFPEFNAAGSLVPAYGNKKEGVCAPYINSGLFASFLTIFSPF